MVLSLSNYNTKLWNQCATIGYLYTFVLRTSNYIPYD